MNVEVYIPTEMPDDKPIVAYRSLGKLRDQRKWDDHNKYEKASLHYNDPSELPEDGVNIIVYGVKNEGVTEFFTNPEDAWRVIGDSSKAFSVLFDGTVYPPLEFPLEVNMFVRKSKDHDGKDGYACFIHTNPNRNGLGNRGKIFFSHSDWIDVAAGPAEVSISKEMEGYGFVKGRMIRFDDITLNEGATYRMIASRFDSQSDCGKLLLIDHPVRGKYIAHLTPQGKYRLYLIGAPGEAYSWTDKYSEIIEADFLEYGVRAVKLKARIQWWNKHADDPGQNQFKTIYDS